MIWKVEQAVEKTERKSSKSEDNLVGARKMEWKKNQQLLRENNGKVKHKKVWFFGWNFVHRNEVFIRCRIYF